MTLQEKIRQRRVEQGMSLTETAKRLGISRETLYRYETGKIAKIPMQYLTTLAHILKTDVSYFINNIPQNAGVPMRGIANCGLEIVAESEITDFYACSGVRADFCVRVSGCELEESGIHDGDIVMIQTTQQVESGDAVALLHNGKLLLRRLRKMPGKLILTNAAGAPTILPYPHRCVEILGKAVAFQRILY